MDGYFVYDLRQTNPTARRARYDIGSSRHYHRQDHQRLAVTEPTVSITRISIVQKSHQSTEKTPQMETPVKTPFRTVSNITSENSVGPLKRRVDTPRIPTLKISNIIQSDVFKAPAGKPSCTILVAEPKSATEEQVEEAEYAPSLHTICVENDYLRKHIESESIANCLKSCRFVVPTLSRAHGSWAVLEDPCDQSAEIRPPSAVEFEESSKSTHLKSESDWNEPNDELDALFRDLDAKFGPDDF